MAWLQGFRCGIQFDTMIWNILSTKKESTLDFEGDNVMGQSGMVGQI